MLLPTIFSSGATNGSDMKEIAFKQEKTMISSTCRKIEPMVVVHGGCGNVSGCSEEEVQKRLQCVKKAARTGYQVLKCGGSSCDAVEAAIRVMEDDPIMNAGIGSALNINGEIESCASIMEGSNMGAGAVAVVKDFAHPISLARLVMEKTRHVLLVGEGARKLAETHNFPVTQTSVLVTKPALRALEKFKENPDANYDIETCKEGGDTVGAVAIDRNGHLASGVSSGGANGRMMGRASDASQIGSGTYADDEMAAAAVTGDGEAICKCNLAHQIVIAQCDTKKVDMAINGTLHKMRDRLLKDAGAICVTKLGQVGVGFTTDQMPWCYQRKNLLVYGINKNDFIEELI